MTENSNDDRLAQQIEIDRLVDGELDDESRRQLLSTLDTRPNGWRQLGLAFVEAQTLQSELRDWAESETAAHAANCTTGRVAGALPGESSQKVSGVVFALAMAASFLVAFVAALWWRGPQEPAGAGFRQAASSGAADAVTRRQSLTVAQDAVEEIVSDHVEPWHSNTSVADTTGDDTQRPIEVPVFAVGSAGDNWQTEIGSALPRHVVESLQRTGYRIKSQKDFHTIKLPDGRRVVIPVEQVEVQFEGPQIHQ